jgi:uncharacterized protein YwgA
MSMNIRIRGSLRPNENRVEKIPLSLLILSLLSIGAINGKTMLQKQVFLSLNEVFSKDEIADGLFVPDRYGPYSRLVVDIADYLKKEGLLKIVPKGEGKSRYVITPKGSEKVQEMVRSKEFLIKKMELLRDKKSDWDEWTSTGVKIYIYRKYPEFATRTEVPELLW